VLSTGIGALKFAGHANVHPPGPTCAIWKITIPGIPKNELEVTFPVSDRLKTDKVLVVEKTGVDENEIGILVNCTGA